MTHSRPRSPLRAFASKGGYLLASPGPQSSTSAGHGSGATDTSPASGEVNPCFILWKVRVASAGSTSGPPSPVGMSQASTGASSPVAHAATSAIGGRRLFPGAAPAPSRQSTTSECFSIGASGQTRTSPAAARASRAILPRDSGWLASTVVWMLHSRR